MKKNTMTRVRFHSDFMHSMHDWYDAKFETKLGFVEVRIELCARGSEELRAACRSERISRQRLLRRLARKLVGKQFGLR